MHKNQRQSARKFILATLATGVLAAFPITNRAQDAVNKTAPPKPPAEDVEALRKTIRQLRTENTRFKTRLAELEKRMEVCSIRNRLIQEEQRAENLRSQLLANLEKEAPLQSRMDEIKEQLRSENIDRLPVLGSLRPEEVRDTARRRLTSEQQRLQTQLDLLSQSRTRLQASLATTEMLIQSLRVKLQSVSGP